MSNATPATRSKRSVQAGTPPTTPLTTAAHDEATANTRAVVRLVEEIGSARTQEEAAAIALGTVREQFRWAYGSFWRLDTDTRTLVFSVDSGSVNPEFQQVTTSSSFKEGEGLSGKAWRSRDLVFVADLGEMKDCSRAPVAIRAGVKSGICFPVLCGGEVIGTMDFFAMTSLAPSEERLEVLRSVSRIVSEAIGRLRNIQRQNEEARSSIAVTEVIAAVGEARTLREAALAAIDRVRSQFDWAYGSFWPLDEASGTLKFGCDSGTVNDEFARATATASFKEGEGLSGRAWRSRDIVFVKDLGEITDCCRRVPAQKAGVKSGVCFPLVVGGRVMGTMDFFSLKVLDLSPERLGALRTVGKLVSAAMERIVEAERQAESAANTIAINGVLESLQTVDSVNEAIKTALATVRESFGWAYGSYWSLDAASKTLAFAVESGTVNAEFAQATASTRFREGEGLSGRAWRQRELVFVPDLSEVTDCPRRVPAQRAGVKSGVCFPITLNGEVVGTMDFFSLSVLQPNKERLDSLRNVGRLVSSAMSRIADNDRRDKTAAKILEVVEELSASASQMSSVASTMTSNATETSAQANVVSSAAEQINTNVQTVASGSEEMTASIKLISQSASAAADISTSAVGVASKATGTISRLGDSSDEIGNVVKLINTIAQQTNLLALNATIEAARAGEAGKGFAVVANEVKELAKNTTVATADISKRIQIIQTDTKQAVGAMKDISDVISKMNEIATSIAGAVEEQSATTSEMSRNITEMVRGTNEISQNISGVAVAAESTTKGAVETTQSANGLAKLANELKDIALQFRGGSKSASGASEVSRPKAA